MDYVFLGADLTYLIVEWIKEERLNAFNVVLPFMPSDPSTRGLARLLDSHPWLKWLR